MGSVVISIDAELGWGFHDLADPPVDRVEAARDGWWQLLDLFEEYRVPATWGIVGHLFLEECDGVHADHPAPDDWFGRERGEWRNRPDLRFGDELVTDLLGADTDHDIGSHTFSHVIFGDSRVDRRIVRAELGAAIEAASERDVEYDSFIFPRNKVAHRDLLAEFGFTVYRGARREMPDGIRQPISKIAAAVNTDQVRLVEPYVDEYGLVDVPPSLFVFGFEGMARTAVESVWDDPVVRQVEGGIDRAVDENGTLHLWLHPNNLITRRDIDRMRAILEYIDRRRKSGLTVETMAGIAERIRPLPRESRAGRI